MKESIMTKGNLTREQAVELVGEAAVSAAENCNCDITGRVGYNGACQGDELTEWRASASGVEVYYYTTNEEDKVMAENDGDGSSIDWTVAGYEVV